MKAKRVYLIMQPPTAHSYWTELIIEGVYQEAARRDAQLALFDSPEALVESAAKPDNVLLIGYSNHWFTRSADHLKKHGVGVTLVSAYISVDERYNAVLFALPSAVREALAYLKQAGRERVAFIGINPDSPADCAKAVAYEQAAGELSMAHCIQIPGGEVSLQNCVEALLQQIERFDAAICANDPVAFCLIERLRREGFKVPEDLFIIGMGNSRFGRIYHLPVTSIAFDYHALGRKAVHLYMLAGMNDPDLCWRITLPCRLIVRETTAYVQHDGGSGRIPHVQGEELSSYYRDPDVHFFNRVEALLRQCDEWDDRIIQGLLRSETYQQLSHEIHFSERSIKYRVKKMMQRAGVETRAQLCALLQPIWAQSDES